MYPTLRRTLCTLLFLLSCGCGSGANESRPIEILFFAQGPTGTEFEFQELGDPPDCLAFSTSLVPTLVPSAGRGFQSTEAEHILPGTFVAPYLFLIENEVQPVRGVFRNLSETVALNVQRLLVLGVLDEKQVPPGQCRSLTSFSDAEEATAVPPIPSGREARIDVCSFERDQVLPTGFLCRDAAARGGDPALVDVNATFFGSIGDMETSYLTRCLQPQGTDRTDCQTPATIFLNDPREAISIVISPLPTQTKRLVHGDLYINGRLRDSDTSTADVILSEDI